MALTPKKRKFVDALKSGLSGAKAAVHAGYSEKGAAQAASRLMKDPDVLAALERTKDVNKQVNNVNQDGKHKLASEGEVLPDKPEQKIVPDIGLDQLGLTSDPKKVLVAIMNDGQEDPKLRLEAAKALMPFVHPRVAPQGKKEAQNSAAKKANRFMVQPPPNLKVVR